MRKTQFAAFLLSGLLVLNTAIPAFAEGMTEPKENAQTYALPDTEAPELKGATLSAQEVKAGESITVTINAEDDVSGIDKYEIIFLNKSNGRKIDSYPIEDKTFSIDISKYEESGIFEVSTIILWDKAGNVVIYGEFGDEELPKPIPTFKVINKDDELVPGESDDELVPGQSENRPSKPERPSKPNNSGSSSGAVVNYDSERPDPADKKATEMYNFWQNVKRKIKNTEEGKTLRVAVPAEYTYMPASVMETLRLNPQVGLKLSWSRDTVVIKAGTAQPKQKLKVYWTKKQLIELYCK